MKLDSLRGLLRKVCLLTIMAGLLAGLGNCSDSPSSEYDESVTSFAHPGEGLPHYQGKDLQPFWPDQESPTAAIREITDFRLTKQDGTNIQKSDLKGSITVVAFFFTKCQGICPRVTQNLKQIQDRFSKVPNIRMVSFSVTPETDTPEILRDYARKQGIDTKFWSLVTGSRKAIYGMARESFNADTVTVREAAIGRGENDFLHSESVYLLDRKMRLRGVYNGRIRSDIDQLTRDVALLEKEAETP